MFYKSIESVNFFLWPWNTVAFNVKVNWSEDFAVPEVADATSSVSGDASEVASLRETEDGGENFIHLQYLSVSKFSFRLV